MFTKKDADVAARVIRARLNCAGSDEQATLSTLEAHWKTLVNDPSHREILCNSVRLFTDQLCESITQQSIGVAGSAKADADELWKIIQEWVERFR